MSCKMAYQFAVFVWVACFLVAFPQSTDAKALDETRNPTTQPPHFEIVINEESKATAKPRRFQNIYKRRCCTTGKQAARKGYSCYIKRDIGRIRINMPMRYKMKTEIHGNKYDFVFAMQMSFCSKTPKLTRKFNHCCDKTARNMDRRTVG